jgi:RNA polymerase sigma-70 factor (ECF subfamily)
MSEVDDVNLLDRARRGDEEAFSQLFARHQRDIYRYGTYMCGPGAGDDIVQDTFLAVLRQTGRRDALRGTVIAYLFGIARHMAMKRLSHRSDISLDEVNEAGQTVPTREATVLDTLTRAETIDAVRRAVQSLPQAYREAVVLCDIQQMDYGVAAGVIGCPIGTVRSRLSRARALLATKLAATRCARYEAGG